MPLRIGLIDRYCFSQECMVEAFAAKQPDFVLLAFKTVEECILQAGQGFDLILYYNHASGMASLGNISEIRKNFLAIPLVVLSDAEDADQPHAICGTLKQGADGFIPTRTMGISLIVAAILFVKAGGTFAPLDLLVAGRQDVRHAPVAEIRYRLTSRETMLLSYLQQGKANKIIAYELGMSVSTVKVHVRNIMRKTGTANRTHAAYKALSLPGAAVA